MNLDNGFYVLQVPHQSRPTLTWFRNLREFKAAYELGWREYPNRVALIRDAGWTLSEIPQAVLELPAGVPVHEWSFGWQPSQYEVGFVTDDVIEQMISEAAGHDMHASRVIAEDDLAALHYHGHQEAAVSSLIAMEVASWSPISEGE